jgi:FHA domain
MSSHLETTHDLAPPLLADDAPGSIGVDRTAVVAEDAGTVSIEFNFKAFADDVPTTEHARRQPNYGDPSIQDFADQVLELAALRAELKRLARDYEILRQQARSREAGMDVLRRELSSARAQLRQARRQQSQATAPQAAAAAAQENGSFADTADVSERSQSLAPELTATLEVPLTAAVRSDLRPGSHQTAAPQLIPVDQAEHPIVLSRDIVTIGRTRNNDVCIRSRAVSRDHARLLVTQGSVTLVDVSSTNGCFVNDEPVKRHRLRAGDLVRIGDRQFRFAPGHRL